MELNNNLGVKVNNAGESVQASPSAKSEGSQAIVFTTNLSKVIKNLTEKELKYLQEQGYDITKMTEADVTEALMPFYASSRPETSVKNTTIAPTVQSKESQTPEQLQANVVSTVAEPQSSEIVENSTIQAPISDVKLDAKEKNYISPTEVKIDYNSEDMKEFDILPEEGKYACDFYTLPKEERENFFVTELAKKLFGEQWNSMSPEEQAQALKTVEADLTKNVKSWKSLNAEDKEKLALAFYMASDDEATMNLRYDGDMEANFSEAREKSLDAQIEATAQAILNDPNRKLSAEDFNNKMTAEVEARFGTSQEAKKNFWANQLTYLEEKQASGMKLTEQEQHRLDLLTNLKNSHHEKRNDDKWQYALSNNFNYDYQTSTLGLMKKDEHYLEVYATRKAQYHANGIQNAEEKADKDATLDYLKHQFEGVDKRDEDAVRAKIIELQNNCSSPEEQIQLTKLLAELHGSKNAQFCNDNIMRLTMADAVAAEAKGKEPSVIVHHLNNGLSKAYEEGLVSSEAISGITYGMGKSLSKTHPEIILSVHDVMLNKKFGQAAAEGIVQATKDGVYQKDLEEKVYTRPLETVKNKDAIRTLSSGIPHTDKSIRIKTFNNYNDYAVKHKDAELVGSLGEGISKYDVDEQQQVMKTLMTSSYEFDDNTAQVLQKGFADQIQYCHKNNQLALHDEVMSSRFESVQTHAAGNIKNYDNSVKAEAVARVLDSGNIDAIQNICNDIVNSPASYPEVTGVVEMVAKAIVLESVYQSELESGDLNQKFLAGSLTLKELSKLTPKERREYFLDKFEKLSPLQKLEMIKKFVNSNMFGDVQKRTIYILIARSSLLKSMVDSGEGGKMLETPGMPPDAKNRVIKAMKQSTAGNVVQQRRDEKYKQYFEEEHIMLTQEKSKKYATPTGTFMKDTFTPNYISNEQLKKLKDVEATMYYNS